MPGWLASASIGGACIVVPVGRAGRHNNGPRTVVPIISPLTIKVTKRTKAKQGRNGRSSSHPYEIHLHIEIS